MLGWVPEFTSSTPGISISAPDVGGGETVDCWGAEQGSADDRHYSRISWQDIHDLVGCGGRANRESAAELFSTWKSPVPLMGRLRSPDTDNSGELFTCRVALGCGELGARSTALRWVRALS